MIFLEKKKIQQWKWGEGILRSRINYIIGYGQKIETAHNSEKSKREISQRVHSA